MLCGWVILYLLWTHFFRRLSYLTFVCYASYLFISGHIVENRGKNGSIICFLPKCVLWGEASYCKNRNLVILLIFLSYIFHSSFKQQTKRWLANSILLCEHLSPASALSLPMNPFGFLSAVGFMCSSPFCRVLPIMQLWRFSSECMGQLGPNPLSLWLRLCSFPFCPL